MSLPDSLPLLLLIFLGAGAVIVFSGVHLAHSGDVLAERTGLGQAWFGAIFVALATSLPELVTGISSILIGAPALTGGNLFGANMTNVAVLGALFLFFPPHRLVRRAAREHLLTMLVALLMTTLAVFFIILPQVRLGWIGLGSLVILAMYAAGMREMYRYRPADEVDHPSSGSLLRAVVVFLLAAAGVTVAAPVLAQSAEGIATHAGVSETFLGVLGLALVTTTPETTVNVAAVRRGAVNLALGNLFGSNAFNMFIFVVLDAVYTGGAIFAAMDMGHVVTGLMAILLMVLAMSMLTVGSQKRFSLTEPSASLLLLGYGLGLYLVYLIG